MRRLSSYCVEFVIVRDTRIARGRCDSTINERDLLRPDLKAASFRREPPAATVLTDDGLRAVTVPARFLHDVVGRGLQVVAPARRARPPPGV